MYFCSFCVLSTSAKSIGNLSIKVPLLDSDPGLRGAQPVQHAARILDCPDQIAYHLMDELMHELIMMTQQEEVSHPSQLLL